jgi:hypothetical protein
MSKAYIELLKDPRWQKKRLQVMARDQWRCKFCWGETEMLSVHHRRYTGRPWEAPDEDLVTLCERCHEATTALLKASKRVLEDMELADLTTAAAFLRSRSLAEDEGVIITSFNEADGVGAAFGVSPFAVERVAATNGGRVTRAAAHESQEELDAMFGKFKATSRSLPEAT